MRKYEEIASCSTRQESEKLKTIAEELPDSKDFQNAGIAAILYKKVAEFSEDGDVNQLKILAKELSYSGDRLSAKVIYEKVISLSGEEDTEELKTIAETLSKSGDDTNAADLYKGITLILDRAENIPNQRKSEVQLSYGSTLKKLNKISEAEEAFRAVINYEPNKFDPYFYLCLLSKDSKDSKKSNEGILFCDQALRLDPGDNSVRRARIWYERGLLLEKEEETVSAALESFLFSYAILASNRAEDIKKIDDEESASSGSSQELTTGKPDDLEQLSMTKIKKEYNALMTRKLLSLVLALETDSKIPVLAPTDPKGVQPTIISDPVISDPVISDPVISDPVVMSMSDFPLYDCGEHFEEKQHRDLYLVFIKYSKDDLASVKDQFCGDSWRTRDNKEIQVASFADRNNANKLAELLRKSFDGVRVSPQNEVDE
jgi:tetratricopeptide (TPR) repeat protein